MVILAEILAEILRNAQNFGRNYAYFFVANVAFTRFFCRDRECRDYVLFGVEFWQKFIEILRILAEILKKKLACGASAEDEG